MTRCAPIPAVGVDPRDAAWTRSRWRIERHALARGVEEQWCSARRIPFNEARLLGHAVGMDVEQLVAAGLVRQGQHALKGGRDALRTK